MPYNPQPDLDFAVQCDRNAAACEAEGNTTRAHLFRQQAGLQRQYVAAHLSGDKQAMDKVDAALHEFRVRFREQLRHVAEALPPTPTPVPTPTPEPTPTRKRGWWYRTFIGEAV